MQSEPTVDTGFVDTRFFLRAIQYRWQWIAAGAVAGILTAVLLVTGMPQAYTSTASVFLEPLVGNPYSPTTPPSRTEQLAALTTEAGVVLTDAVVTAATEEAASQGFDISPVRPNTATEIPSNSQVIDISFTSNDPAAAQVGAQALAHALLDFRRDRAESVYASQAEVLEQRREAIETLLNGARKELSTLADTEEARAIDLEQQVRLYSQQFAQVQLDQTSIESRTVSAGSILRSAAIPTDADGLSVELLAAAAFLLLTFVGIFIALLVEHAGRRVRNEGDITRWGAPTSLGNVSGSERGDSVRYLRALPSIEESLTGGIGVLVSLGDTHGVVTAALGIARAAALSGRTTCVVAASSGLSLPSESLSGLTDALQKPRHAGDLSDIYVDQGKDVTLILPGTLTAQLPILVQSERCAELLGEVANSFDQVLVVTSWDERVAAVKFARLTGTAVLVATRQSTTGPDLLVAATALRRLSVAIKGSLLVDPRRKRRRARKGSRADSTTWDGA